jgi:hypothetical protein
VAPVKRTTVGQRKVAWDIDVMRVPYPLGFFAKGMDGRIDDPKASAAGAAQGVALVSELGRVVVLGEATMLTSVLVRANGSTQHFGMGIRTAMTASWR